MADTGQFTLPITGIICANCVATVERDLKKLDGACRGAGLFEPNAGGGCNGVQQYLRGE